MILFSCNNEKVIKPKIAARINNQCSQAECVINLKDVTEFKWQKMYLFKTGTSLENIDRALGFHYLYFEDIADRIIFVLDKKVVYHEDEFTNPESKPRGGVIFQISDIVPYYTTDSSNAYFNVKRESVNGNKYYELTPSSVSKILY